MAKQDKSEVIEVEGIVEECLSLNSIHPLLQTIHNIVFSVIRHNYFFFLVVVELARLRTQRKPI